MMNTIRLAICPLLQRCEPLLFGGIQLRALCETTIILFIFEKETLFLLIVQYVLVGDMKSLSEKWGTQIPFA